MNARLLILSAVAGGTFLGTVGGLANRPIMKAAPEPEWRKMARQDMPPTQSYHFTAAGPQDLSPRSWFDVSSPSPGWQFANWAPAPQVDAVPVPEYRPQPLPEPDPAPDLAEAPQAEAEPEPELYSTAVAAQAVAQRVIAAQERHDVSEMEESQPLEGETGAAAIVS